MIPKPKQRSLTLSAVSTMFLAISLAGCAAPGPKSSGTGDEVTLSNLEFQPQELTVTAGTTVRFVNEDHMPHDVMAGDRSWESDGGSGGMGMGATFTKMFDTPGEYRYYCTLHSSGPGNGMWGTIIVE